MEMQPVTSTNVAAIGYSPESQELHVQYKSGLATYVYGKVPAAKWAALQVVASKGSYIAVEIKGKHPMLRREVPESAEAESPTRRYVCGRCAGFDAGNTATSCVRCGTDTVMGLVEVTTEPDGAYRLTMVPEAEQGEGGQQG